MAEGGAGVSIEIRHVIVGDCDCGIPCYSWEEGNCHEHYWECDYGRIPSFDLKNPAPLIISSCDWVRRVFAMGECRIGDRLDAISLVPPPDERGEDSEVRMFQRTVYGDRSWTWELEPAHWADPPTRHNNARIPIYLGRWPD